MSTWFGNIIRAGANVIQAPIQAITGKTIFNKSYTGDTSTLPTNQLSSWFSDAVGGGALKDKGTTGTNDVTALIGNAINTLFGGVADRAGTAAGTAAGKSITNTAPAWLWPIILIGALVVVLGFVFVSKKRGKRK